MCDMEDTSISTRKRDPFLITSEDRLGFVLFMRQGLFDHPEGEYDDTERCRRKVDQSRDWDTNRNILPATSRTERREITDYARFIERMSLGILGELAIITPMVIMAVKNSLLTSLLSQALLPCFSRAFSHYPGLEKVLMVALCWLRWLRWLRMLLSWWSLLELLCLLRLEIQTLIYIRWTARTRT